MGLALRTNLLALLPSLGRYGSFALLTCMSTSARYLPRLHASLLREEQVTGGLSGRLADLAMALRQVSRSDACMNGRYVPCHGEGSAWRHACQRVREGQSAVLVVTSGLERSERGKRCVVIAFVV